MQEMYGAKVNSPLTTLASAITAVQTSITLTDAAVLPAAPNICTIGIGDTAETIKYTSIVGNVLSGVTRGFQGTPAAWAEASQVARYFTAYDHDSFIENIVEISGKLNNVTWGKFIGM